MPEKAKPETAMPKVTAPKRVELVNTKRQNGPVGAIARPLEKDVAAWLGKGWQRKSAGSAE